MNDATRMSAELTAEGLLTPPIGGDPDAIAERREWFWGSVEIPTGGLYMFDWHDVAAVMADQGPFFALSHEGHGVNSYGLNLVTYGGELAVFCQHSFGGMYDSALKTRLSINSAYTYLHVLLGLKQETRSPEPPGRPKALLVYSDFRNVCGIVDLRAIGEGLSIGEAMRDLSGFRELMSVAASIVPERNVEVSGFDE